MHRFKTCVDVLKHIENSYYNPNALNWRDDDGNWHATSTGQFLYSVKMIALGLKAIGVKRGDCVGILAQPSPDWVMVDFAIMIVGAISVPLFANISDENFVHEVTQTNLKILFVEGSDPWGMFKRQEDLFDYAIAFDSPQHAKAKTLKEIMALGEHLDREKPHCYGDLESQIEPLDIAAIIYTSGSTGMPKGVELTHENLTTVLDFPEFKWTPTEDCYLSILPLAHVLGHCANLWMLASGVSIYYSSDYRNLASVCREVKPTVMVVVPRLLEKVYTKMSQQIQVSQGIKGKIARSAFALAKKNHLSVIDRLFKPIADRLVFNKLRTALGGKVRVVISGGAPLNPHLQHFYEQIGIPVYEGWGLTEACPVCVNTPKRHKTGTVGIPVSGQTVMVNLEGEILLKGTLVMRGYFDNPEATSKALDSDGWLHTGDRGKLDADGFLTILGRMKELYKTSTGEYVAPVPIEQILGRHFLIEFSLVVADGHKFATCLLFPNLDAVLHTKKEMGLESQSVEEFLQGNYVRSQMDQLIGTVNEHVNHWEQIHDYRMINEPLTVQSGELTPSMKIRRNVVINKYKNLINEMYAQYQEEAFQ